MITTKLASFQYKEAGFLAVFVYFEGDNIMTIYDSCQPAIQSCLGTRTFALAWMYSDEKTMDMHIHDCYEIYFSISGGKQFLIDRRLYDVDPGNIFFINQFESHHLTQVDAAAHERIVISIHPEYLKRLSTTQTDLSYCFTCRDTPFGHKIMLSKEYQKRFTFFIHKLSESRDYGQDIIDRAVFQEMMACLNYIFISCCNGNMEMPATQMLTSAHYEEIDELLSFINQHLAEDLSMPVLASRLHFSSSYLRKLFKDATGTTITRYIIAKRISMAKLLLSDGHSVTETSILCGFQDYSNFLKTFTKMVGVSPKKYVSCEH